MAQQSDDMERILTRFDALLDHLQNLVQSLTPDGSTTENQLAELGERLALAAASLGDAVQQATEVLERMEGSERQSVGLLEQLQRRQMSAAKAMLRLERQIETQNRILVEALGLDIEPPTRPEER